MNVIFLAALLWSQDPSYTSDNIYRWHLKNTDPAPLRVFDSAGNLVGPEPGGVFSAHVEDAWKLQPHARNIKVAVLDEGNGYHLEDVVGVVESAAPGVQILRYPNAWPPEVMAGKITAAAAAGANVIVITSGSPIHNGWKPVYAALSAANVWTVCAAPNINSYSCDRPGFEDYPSAFSYGPTSPWGPALEKVIGVTGFSLSGDKTFSSSTNFFHVAAPARRLQTRNGYFNSGNSFAAGVTAGVAALMLEKGVTDVRNRLIASADGGLAGHSVGGRLNAWRALGGRELRLRVEAGEVVETAVSVTGPWEVYRAAGGAETITIRCVDEKRFFRKVLDV